MPVTIRDIARNIGISASTVSRALSRPALVNEATRALVLEEAARLGYQGRPMPQEATATVTGHIGVIVPDLTNPLYAGLVKGVQIRSRESGRTVVVVDFDNDPSAELAAILALSSLVDGLVVSSPSAAVAEVRRAAAGRALVLHNRRSSTTSSVAVDNRDGIAQAVRHLIALGHRRIGYVGDHQGSESDGERVEGLRAAQERHDLELVEVGNVTPHYEGGLAAADLVVAARLTGVVTFNDEVALGLMARLRARGLSVPAQLSVIGFDDAPLSRMSSPALTSVAVPQEPAGRICVDLLLEQFAGRKGAAGEAVAPRTVELATQLMVRGTTAEPPSGR